jgi:hypothetical protein
VLPGNRERRLLNTMVVKTHEPIENKRFQQLRFCYFRRSLWPLARINRGNAFSDFDV